MPLTASQGIGLAGGFLGLAGNAFNIGATEMNNKRQRKWAEGMYNRQRQDALSDWNMVNAYNTPEAQMARLKQAGLNPNLVYGNGATTEATATRGTDVKGWNPDAPTMNLGAIQQGLMSYMDAQVKEAQTNNLEAATEVARQDALKRVAEILNLESNTKKTDQQRLQDAYRFEELKDLSLDVMREEINSKRANTQYTISENERKAAMQAGTLEEQTERILTMRIGRDEARTRIDNAKKDGTLKDLEINLRKMGINPNDPMWSRVLGQFIQSLIKDKEPKTDTKIQKGRNWWEMFTPRYAQ